MPECHLIIVVEHEAAFLHYAETASLSRACDTPLRARPINVSLVMLAGYEGGLTTSTTCTHSFHFWGESACLAASPSESPNRQKQQPSAKRQCRRIGLVSSVTNDGGPGGSSRPAPPPWAKADPDADADAGLSLCRILRRCRGTLLPSFHRRTSAYYSYAIRSRADGPTDRPTGEQHVEGDRIRPPTIITRMPTSTPTPLPLVCEQPGRAALKPANPVERRRRRRRRCGVRASSERGPRKKIKSAAAEIISAGSSV